MDSASLAEKWIRSVATETCSSLKEVSISVSLTGASLTLTDEILSVGKSLTKLKICSASRNRFYSVWMKTPINNNSNSIINCVSLREVVLIGVRISQEVLDGIFSTCSLLENIELDLHEQNEPEHRTIKIKNPAHLHKINIYSGDGDSTDLEIRGVPSLRFFRSELNFEWWFGRPDLRPFSAYSISLGSSVTELWLGGLITDESSLEMIKSGFPFLESLTLDMSNCWTLGIFHFTCASLKTLYLMWAPRHKLTEVKVYAPKLLSLIFRGYTLPIMSFPVSTLVQTTFNLSLNMPLDASFFIRMRKALTLSTKCDVSITTKRRQKSDIDLVDLRRRLPFPPANNVQRLEFQVVGIQDYGRFPFLNAFCEICHPTHILAKPDVISGHTHTNHFFELMVREVLEKKKMNTRRYWPTYLKHVQIGRHHNWETLRNSHMSTFLDRPIYFKLNWH